MIQYAIYQSKANNYTKGKFYARAIHTDIVDLEGIAEHMCRHNCSYSKGQIIGLLDDMVGCIREICLDGNAVKLPDFAIFKPGIRTKGAKTAKEFTATENVLRTYIKEPTLKRGIF